MEGRSYLGMKNSVLTLCGTGGRQINGVNLMNNLSLCLFCGVDVVKRDYELCLQLTWRRGKSSLPLLTAPPPPPQSPNRKW